MMFQTNKIHLQHLLLKAFLIIMLSLVIGVLGYHYSENMKWIDALFNASMILGGMEPVNELHSVEGKLFASFYALYSCFIVLGIISIMITPAMHSALRKYHMDPDNEPLLKPKKN